MADLHGITSFEDETDPPGTFKLIRGPTSFIPLAGLLLTSHLLPDREADEHGQRIVVLDPIPSSDPNEPLVGYPQTLLKSRAKEIICRTGARCANQLISRLFWL